MDCLLHHLPTEKRVCPARHMCMAQWLPSGMLPSSSKKGFVPLPLEEQGSVGYTYRLSLCPLTVCHLVARWHFRAGLWGTHTWVSCS